MQRPLSSDPSFHGLQRNCDNSATDRSNCRVTTDLTVISLAYYRENGAGGEGVEGMSSIETVEWDSRILGLPVGRLVSSGHKTEKRDLSGYSQVVARVPQQRIDKVAELQSLGFRFIGLDLRLTGHQDEVMPEKESRWKIRRIDHTVPDFVIDGFRIDDSRLMLDPECRIRLPEKFWDELVYEHCAGFSDVVICAITDSNSLAGFVSCLVRPPYLDLFMVAVHPEYQRAGLGSTLLQEAAVIAGEKNLMIATNVMASNVGGINFYVRHNYMVESGEVVMHYWKEDEHHVQ